MSQSKVITKQEKKLPSLSELHNNIQEAFKNDEFKTLLNQPPPETWLKDQLYGNGRYLPIDKTEFLLDRIFQEWKVEVLREGVMFQSVYVTIRLHYRNPINGQWYFHDGVGAKSVQTDKGFSASDLSHIKDAAVQMSLPSAKSYAIKDACDHIGRLFGRDINRKDVAVFVGAYEKKEEVKENVEDSRLMKLISEAKTIPMLEDLLQHCKTQQQKMAFESAMLKLKKP